MSGEIFLLDSSFLLDYLKGHEIHSRFLRDKSASAFIISVVTEMELFSFPEITADEERIIEKTLAHMEIVPLDDGIKKLAIAFRRSTRRKLPDSIIAASAIFCEAPLITSDKALLGAVFPGFRALGPDTL